MIISSHHEEILSCPSYVDKILHHERLEDFCKIAVHVTFISAMASQVKPYITFHTDFFFFFDTS